VDERLASALRLLPDYLSQHVLLSAASLGLGVAVSLPLVVAASRSARVRWPVLGLASLIQTVPSLALLALFYPLLLGLASVFRHLFGFGFNALGFLPSLLALTLYSMLPILRNGVTAVLNIDPAIIQAASGVGMTDRQRLLRVELPLAAPMIMAGVRTSAVWVIGTATLATPVGQTSLGNYIFSGLQVENWVWVLFGCGAAVALALVTDQLLALVEHGVSRRRPRLAWLGIVLLLAGVGVCGFVPIAGASRAGYLVGAKNFSEQYTLAALMADRIRATGHSATERTGLGSVFAFRALAANNLDVYVDYSGTLWNNILGRRDLVPREQMLQELRSSLRTRYGVTLLGPLGFENAYALAMRRGRAAALGIHTIEDLARLAPELTIGGDLEFFARPVWQSLRSRYGLKFRARREYQPTFMYRALMSDEVDVISAFSSDGRIAADHLLVLQDPLQAIPPYDAVVLLAPSRATDPVLRRALEPLIGAIPIDLMRRANYMVDRPTDKRSPGEAAVWLAHATHLN
jgi:osmoprotectant transport system substrate-binding protein/osmoprotectant transport system permease protein